MATARHYKKAPIVEAIIDVKFEAPFAIREMERLRDRFKGQFLSVEERRTFRVEFGPKAGPQESTLAGYKMTSKNATDVVLINQNSVGTARLAPYENWEKFARQAETNFDVVTKVVGRKKIIRVGVRFINRLDIPNEQMANQPLNKFLRIGVSLPPEVSEVISNFNFVVQGKEPETGTPFNLRSGIMGSTLIDCVSVQLDIDVFWDTEIPGRIDEMWAGIERLHQSKNSIFEHCITDELRKLFE